MNDEEYEGLNFTNIDDLFLSDDTNWDQADEDVTDDELNDLE